MKLTNGQKMLWTGMKMNPDRPIYNIIFSFDILGKIDVDLFRRSFDLLVKKSDVLRITIHEHDDDPFQKINEDVPYELQLIDFSEKQNIDASIESFFEQKKIHRYDLQKCLFDVAIIKCSENRFIFSFNMHHLINDAIGHFVLFRKLNEIYAQLESVGNANDINIQPFRHFVDFEQQLTNNESLSASYWKEKGSTIHPVSLYNRSKGMSTEAHRMYFELGEERSQKLYELTKSGRYKSFNQDLAVFQVLSSALVLYFHQVSGQTSISFGSPTHNRIKPEFRDTPGLFIEFFPLQFDINPEETISSLHKKVVAESFDFLKHAKVGLSTPDVNRKFNILFNYVNAIVNGFAGHKVTSTYLSSGHNDPRHDLIVQVNDYDQTGNLKVQFDYKKELFEDPIPEFMKDHFLNCIDAILEEPYQQIAETSITSKEEEDYLVTKLNQTKKEWSEKGTLIDLFTDQAKLNPDRVALTYEDRNVSYRELDQLSNKLANYLLEIGVMQGEVIGLAIPRSVQSIVGILGIQKAGAAYCPIDLQLPTSRIDYIINNSRCKKVLVDQQMNKYAFADDVKKIDINQIRENDQAINLTSDDGLAYVIYTSGSTGNPKGVKITHRAIKNRVLWMKYRFEWERGDKLLHKTPYSFDISVWEVFWPLIVGGHIVVTHHNGHTDPNYLQKMIKIHAIKYVHFVPSMLSAFLDSQNISDLPSLKYIFCSGEKLSTKLQQQVLDHSKVKLINLYGPTEAAVEATIWTCDQTYPSDEVPIGRPIDNVQVFVLDKTMKLVPYGSTGKLYLGGVQLSQGYIYNKELTQKSFINSPLINETLYNTGDLVYYGKGENLIFVGRNDTQVKIRGYRIELAEIETALQSNPKVIKAVVVVENESDHPRLICFYQVSSVVDKASLEGWLKSRLPDYMMPNLMHELDQFPVNHNGKTDTLKLIEWGRKLDAGNEKESIHPQAPGNDMEQFLFDIWIEVMGKSPGVNHHFLDIGGDSIQAIKIISRIRSALEIDIPMTFLFEYSTISSGADYLEDLLKQLLAEG